MEEKQTLKQWLDTLEAEGKEVKITWEGGNDDGCYYVSIDDKHINDNYTDKLIDIIADEISYGSFAGDFYTSGELIYEDGHFTGTDNYSTTESDSIILGKDKHIKIEIPEYLWFDTISINTEGNVDDDFSVLVNFNISNGPVVDEHNLLENDLPEMIEREVLDRLQGTNQTANYSYNEWSFQFDEGEVIDGKRTFIIDSIEYSYEDGEDKEICIEITDDAEEQAEQRKREEEERWKKMQEEWNKNKS